MASNTESTTLAPQGKDMKVGSVQELTKDVNVPSRP